ncbi:hypothetical protein Tco_0691307 [Tanacetum coccineum]
MEPDFSNMTLNEYLMYQGRHKDLERSCTSRRSVAPARNRVLVYPNSDEEDEEYCSLPPLLPCFQTPQPCAIIKSVHHNSRNEVDTNNMTLEEYARHELAMSSKKSDTINTTHGFTSQFFNQSQHTPNPPSDKEDSSLDEILDDLFKIGGEENIYVNTTQELEEVQMEDVEMDEDYNIDHSNTEEALQWSLAKDPFLVCMELNDQANFVQRVTLSSISNEVKREFKIPHRFEVSSTRFMWLSGC